MKDAFSFNLKSLLITVLIVISNTQLFANHSIIFSFDNFNANYNTYGFITKNQIPAKPSEFKLKHIDITKVELTWKDNSINEISFAIYRSINDNSSFELLSSLPSNSTSFIDSSINHGKTYYYKLSAINNYGVAETDTLKLVNSYFSEVDNDINGIKLGDVLWGDYDNDRDLDILITGNNENENFSYIYRNENCKFLKQSDIQLSSLYLTDADWGDYDNDGDLDILICMGYFSDHQTYLYKNEGNNKFTELKPSQLQDIIGYSVSWGDYDNDGDLDILISGNKNGYLSKLYENNGNDNFSELKNISLKGIASGSTSWGDYNNDGYLDILMTGTVYTSEATVVYKNNGDKTFSEQNEINLKQVKKSSADWGDYDNDGYLDIALMGIDEIDDMISKIYRNNGDNTFSELTDVSLIGAGHGDLAFGDFDNDNYLDLIITGSGTSNIYKNTGDGSFMKHTNGALLGTSRSSVALGDFDNDNDLDIIQTGEEGNIELKIYKNNHINFTKTNRVKPINLSSECIDSTVNFYWDTGCLSEECAGRTYNVRVGTAPGSSNVRPSHSLGDGTRLIAKRGMIQSTNYHMNLRPGRYYWSVQSIDHAFRGSEFSNEQELIIDCGTQKPEIKDLEVCQNEFPLTVSGENLNWYIAENDQTPFQQGDTINFISEPGSHSFYVTQTIDDCESWDTIITIQVNESPRFIEVSKKAASNCSEADGSITIISNSSKNKYSIDGGDNYQTDNKFSGLFAGNYTIMVKSNMGCIDEHIENLNPIGLNLNALNIENVKSCLGDSAHFFSDSVYTEWYDHNFNYLKTGQYLKPKDLDVGEYRFHAIISHKRCKSDPYELLFTVYELPVGEFDEGGIVEKCRFDTVKIALETSASNIEWSPTSGLSSTNNYNFDIFCKESTDYLITLTDDNGCSSITELKVNLMSTPDIPSIIGRNSVCSGEQNILYSADLNYYHPKWNVVGGTLIVAQRDSVFVNWDKITPTGFISLQLTNLDNNCKTPESTLIVNKTPAAYDKIDVKLKGEYILYVEETGSYQWYNDNKAIEGANEKWLQADNNSLKPYHCLLTHDKVCKILSTPYLFGIDKSKSFPLVSLFPNPTNKNLTIQIPKNNVKRRAILKIFNQNGQEVMNLPFNDNQLSKQVNIENLKDGIFIWKLFVNGNVTCGKFMKFKN